MFKHSRRRRVDPFAVLVAVVALGMTLTLAYQILLYHGEPAPPVAKETQVRPNVGG
ncbi:hypothetical protein [Thiohalocapsa marina]|uniref:hypothetical protein n=1 Tax=Thiohalocapsa marina TaxID=424902 RepID=UPI0014782915|nr:hypothetical protein [Thiohalocapsa marina]